MPMLFDQPLLCPRFALTWVQAVIEKASIDEVYIDVTSLVDSEIQAREASEGWQAQSVDAFAWGSIVLGELPLAVDSEFDRRLSVGAAIACRLRGAVLDQLGAPNGLLVQDLTYARYE